MSVNEKLKRIVDDRGIKQKTLCEKTGMTADCISRILNSTRKVSADEFLILCQVLCVDPRSFFHKSA